MQDNIAQFNYKSIVLGSVLHKRNFSGMI